MTVTQAKLSWYDVDSQVKQLLILASDNWENTELSEQYMNEALAKAGNNLDVLIGAYRFFFYKSKSEAALKIATQVMQIIKQQENLPTEWEQLQPILNSRKNEPAIRLYLNAYAATGFIFAKLGRLEEAKIVTERVKKIDERRESCATTVFEVLTEPPEEDE
jgi:tetratricopeptide (TPR) repeat protein